MSSTASSSSRSSSLTPSSTPSSSSQKGKKGSRLHSMRRSIAKGFEGESNVRVLGIGPRSDKPRHDKPCQKSTRRHRSERVYESDYESRGSSPAPSERSCLSEVEEEQEGEQSESEAGKSE